MARREYLITDYAARRMMLRGISVAEVSGVFGHPTRIEPSPHDPHRLIHRRTIQGRHLVVVAEGIPGPEPWDVVTAWEEGHHE